MSARAKFNHDTIMVVVLIVAIAMGIVLAGSTKGWWAAIYLVQVVICAASLAMKLRRLLSWAAPDCDRAARTLITCSFLVEI